MSLFSKFILLILGFFVLISRDSRICSRSLSLSCAIIVVSSTRIFRNLDLGREWFLRWKAIKLESLRGILSRLERVTHPTKKPQTNAPYTSKQPLIMVCKGSENARDNFGKFINQFQPETKTLIRKLGRILNK